MCPARPIVRPDTVACNKALLWITGGSNNDPAPDKVDGMLAQIAVRSQSVVAELRMTPNQPLVFPDDGQERFEDAIISYTFDKYMASTDPTWPLLLAMVKSAVRAMDTVQAHIKTVESRSTHQVDEFVDGLTGMPLRERQAFNPTSNIAGLLSGYTEEGVKTVLPARAMAKMDFRLVPDQDPDDILAKLQDHLKAEGYDGVRVTKLAGAEPVVTPIEHPFVRRILDISETFAGKPPSIFPIVGGTLPLLGALRRFVGVPGLASPGNPAYWASGAHAPNEHIRLSDLSRAVRFNCYMFAALAAS